MKQNLLQLPNLEKNFLKENSLSIQSSYHVVDDLSTVALVEKGFGICLMPPLFGLFADYVSIDAYPYYLTALFVVMVVFGIIYDRKTAKFRNA